MPVPLLHFLLSLYPISVAFNSHKKYSIGSKNESLETSVLGRTGVDFLSTSTSFTKLQNLCEYSLWQPM